MGRVLAFPNTQLLESSGELVFTDFTEVALAPTTPKEFVRRDQLTDVALQPTSENDLVLQELLADSEKPAPKVSEHVVDEPKKIVGIDDTVPYNSSIFA